MDEVKQHKKEGNIIPFKQKKEKEGRPTPCPELQLAKCSLKLNDRMHIYDFENENKDPRKIFLIKKEIKIKKKDFRRNILLVWKYFNLIKNLPLQFLAKNSNKIIYQDERYLISREIKHLKILKKIEKLRKENKLFEEFLVTEDILKKKSDFYKQKEIYIYKHRKYFFKQRKYKIIEKEKLEMQQQLENNKQIAKCVVRRKKEQPYKKDYTMHSTLVATINRLSPEIKSLTTPTAFFIYRNKDRTRISKFVDLKTKPEKEIVIKAKESLMEDSNFREHPI